METVPTRMEPSSILCRHYELCSRSSFELLRIALFGETRVCIAVCECKTTGSSTLRDKQTIPLREQCLLGWNTSFLLCSESMTLWIMQSIMSTKLSFMQGINDTWNYAGNQLRYWAVQPLSCETRPCLALCGRTTSKPDVGQRKQTPPYSHGCPD